MSLPSRERGLKFEYRMKWYGEDEVAPLAGAWIEIGCFYNVCILNSVAPLAGAWIEMSQMRILDKHMKVAPLAGAWIEIAYNDLKVFGDKSSLPSRERGLKSALSLSNADTTVSLPSRERGLKFTEYT